MVPLVNQKFRNFHQYTYVFVIKYKNLSICQNFMLYSKCIVQFHNELAGVHLMFNHMT